jgi:hypothetical protein
MPCPAQKRVAGSGPRELSFAGPMELTGSGVQACMNGELNGRVGVQCSAIFSMLCCAVQYCGVYVDWAGCWHHGSATAVVLGLVHDSGLWTLDSPVQSNCSIATPSPSSCCTSPCTVINQARRLSKQLPWPAKSIASR